MKQRKQHLLAITTFIALFSVSSSGLAQSPNTVTKVNPVKVVQSAADCKGFSPGLKLKR